MLSDTTDGNSIFVNPSLTFPDASPFCAENLKIIIQMRTEIAQLTKKTILFLFTQLSKQINREKNPELV